MPKEDCSSCYYFDMGRYQKADELLDGWIKKQAADLGAQSLGYWQDTAQIVIQFPEGTRLPELELEGEFRCNIQECPATGILKEYWYLRRELIGHLPGFVTVPYDRSRGESSYIVNSGDCYNQIPEIKIKRMIEAYKSNGGKLKEAIKKKLISAGIDPDSL
jgi:hypothetical protein